MKLGPWQLTGEGGAFRSLVGANPQDVTKRYAFIEKTPRVRIRDTHFVEHLSPTSEDGWNFNDYLNWAQSPFKGDDCLDEKSRKWCDDMLRMLGHSLE